MTVGWAPHLCPSFWFPISCGPGPAPCALNLLLGSNSAPYTLILLLSSVPTLFYPHHHSGCTLSPDSGPDQFQSCPLLRPVRDPPLNPDPTPSFSHSPASRALETPT